MIAAVLPHPALSVTVAIVWMLLVNQLSLAHVLLGLAVGVAVPKLTSVYWPARLRVRNPLLLIEYVAVVMYDIVLSNIQVARLVLFRRGDSLRSQFIRVPLALRSPEAITLLAGTITMTPGTVTADVSADSTALLVHCLEVTTEDEAVAAIKSRYERRLLRIFS